LITSCRKIWIRWWAGRGELGSGVFGFPPLSFGDGLQKQHWPRWDVRMGGCQTFPPIGTAVAAVGGLDAGLLQKLPNEFAALSAVIIESLIPPFPGHQHATSSDA
jgi:hypothetical protein